MRQKTQESWRPKLSELRMKQLVKKLRNIRRGFPMKYRKRSIICLLLAGQMVLTGSCRQKKYSAELLSSKNLTDFPSASAIVYDKGHLYIFGDDAPYLLILDTNYQKTDTVHFIADTSYRLSKDTKPDIESAALVSLGTDSHLYAISSFSNDRRSKLFYFPIANVHSHLSFD